MDWKNEAKERLKVYNAKKQAIESISNEIVRLENQFGSLQSVTTNTVTVNGVHSNEDAFLSNIVLRKELDKRLEDAQMWVDTTEKALSTLDDEERLVLEMFFIRWKQGNIQQLCYDLHVEQATVYRRRDAALRHFTLTLYGICEI